MQTIEDAKTYGVAVKMITGDHLLIAKETARQLDMGDNICDAHGLPLLDEETKAKPPDLLENYGQFIYEHDGFAQVIRCLSTSYGYICLNIYKCGVCIGVSRTQVFSG